jgi:Na+/proline symporter
MSASSAELNALATITTVDFYRRFVRPKADDARIVRVSRLFTLGWGAFAVATAQFAGSFGTLVEAVNILGSLFYGTILGIFMTAFFLKRVGGTAVCLAALAAEALVLCLFGFTNISFLWYNAAGCLAVVALCALSIPFQRYKVSLASSK